MSKKIVGIAGVPPWDIMKEYIDAGAELVDLDEPMDGIAVSDDHLPGVYCSILKRVVSNIIALCAAGKLDQVLAGTGECKCDGMRYIANWIESTSDILVSKVHNMNMVNSGTSVSTSSLPLLEKVELIVNSVFRSLPDGIELVETTPKFGFWGVPPFDFSVLSAFPDGTHVYGWTRCMENKTPANHELEMFVDKDVPIVFFAQSFCQKSSLAFSLAKKHDGLFVEADKAVSKSTRAKIEAYIKFNYEGGK